MQGQGIPKSHGAASSGSDVRYPTLHKPGQHITKSTAASAAAADPDSAEVQYPGIYKPNKKVDSNKVCHTPLLSW